jgi:hypothetical protein
MEELSMRINYRLAKTGEELAKMVQRTITTANTLRKQVQETAVAIIAHAEAHGDYTQANVLVNGLGEGINGRALVEWFAKYGGLVVDEDQGAFVGWQGKDYIRENFSAAKENMWWTLKPQNPWAGLKLEDALQSVITKHDNALKKANKLNLSDEDRARLIDDNVRPETIEAICRLADFKVIITEIDDVPEQQANVG